MPSADPINFLEERERRIVRSHQADGYVELAPLLEELGVKVEERDLPGAISGFATYQEGSSPSGFVVVVNRRHHIVRRRFTAAHELGHCMLHGDEIRRLGSSRHIRRAQHYCPLLREWFDDFNSDEGLVREREADSFAAALLVPEASFISIRRSDEGRFAELAQRFGVSLGTVVKRAKELGKGRRVNRVA